MSQVGEEIRRRREEKGWTGAQLAVRADMAPSAVSQIETGRRNPSSVSLMKVAEALGVEVADLFPKAQAPLPLDESGPRTLEEFLERAGLETRWFTLPDEEFDSWWLDVDWEEAKRRFWQINAEYQIIAAETTAALLREGVTVAPELARQLREGVNRTFARHFGAKAAAPGREETKEEFYERQKRQELRQFKRIDLEKGPEEVVARAS